MHEFKLSIFSQQWLLKEVIHLITIKPKGRYKYIFFFYLSKNNGIKWLDIGTYSILLINFLVILGIHRCHFGTTYSLPSLKTCSQSQKWLQNMYMRLILTSTNAFRYIDDVLSLNKLKFHDNFELEIRDALDSRSLIFYLIT